MTGSEILNIVLILFLDTIANILKRLIKLPIEPADSRIVRQAQSTEFIARPRSSSFFARSVDLISAVREAVAKSITNKTNYCLPFIATE